MTTPKDIDGNELKVGDLVEIAEDPHTHPNGHPTVVGATYFIIEFPDQAYVQKIALRLMLMPLTGFFVRLDDKDFIKSTCLRLIATRDTKAPTKIEFVVMKEGVR